MTASRAGQPSLRRRVAAAGVLALSLALVPAAEAGDLSLAWDEPTDVMTAGFEVEVLDAEGTVVQVLDAGDATSLVVTGLADGELHGFRVRPYDTFGNRAERASAVFSSLPSPRVEEVLGTIAEGEETWVTLRGANFAPGARTIARDGSFDVIETRVVDGDEALVHLVARASVQDPETAVLVVNPVRRSASFASAHPALADLDGSGRVDRADLDLLRSREGLSQGDPGFDPLFDLNADGTIDEKDLSTIKILSDQRVSLGGPS